MDKKKSKPEENLKNKKKKSLGVSIELEDDAEEIFLQALASFDPNAFRKEEVAPRPLTNLQPSKKRDNVKKMQVDLHGLRLEEAETRIQQVFDTVLSQGRGEIEITIITGKGLHSHEGVGVLAKEIHRYVSQHFSKYIVRMDTSPADLMLKGVPIRGHFTVRLKK